MSKRGSASKGGLSQAVTLKEKAQYFPFGSDPISQLLKNSFKGGGLPENNSGIAKLLSGFVEFIAQSPKSLNQTTRQLFGFSFSAEQYAALMKVGSATTITIEAQPNSVELLASHLIQGESSLKFQQNSLGKLEITTYKSINWEGDLDFAQAILHTLYNQHHPPEEQTELSPALEALANPVALAAFMESKKVVPPSFVLAQEKLGEVSPTKVERTENNNPTISTKNPGYLEWGEQDEAGHEWAKKQFEDWRQKLTANETKSCQVYTTEAYRHINGYLRGEAFQYNGSKVNDNLARWHIRHLDKALDKGKLKDNLIVYRGERGQFAERIWEAYRNGKLAEVKASHKPLTYRSYLSTTITLDNFASQHFDSDRVRFRIKAPKGSKCGYMSGVSWEDEREILWPRCSRLEINDYWEDEDGRLNIEATYRPPKAGLPKMTKPEWDAYLAKKQKAKQAWTIQ